MSESEAGFGGARRPARHVPSMVVGIGASAGGLEALEKLVAAIPRTSRVCYVIVQHLSPEHVSLMPELLEKHAPLHVKRVDDGMELVAGSIYVISPGYDLVYDAGKLRQRPVRKDGSLHLPVDTLFESLARGLGERSVGVVLSGSGSDGMRGVRAIKESGGFVIAQDPREAAFDGMPGSAVSTGVVDVVLGAGEIADAIERLSQRPLQPMAGRPEEASSDLAKILQLIEKRTGRDFSGYKRSTILRRIERRMHLRGFDSLEEFVAHLKDNAQELDVLHRDFLIGVTRFFRDTELFKILEERVIPRLLERTADEGGGLRVWCAGCSTGEEAYSLAMLFLEAMEEQGRPRELRIFATDVDQDALAVASQGVYPSSVVADIDRVRIDKFFVPEGDDFRIAKGVRSRVIFAPHDLLGDPPLTSMHLISCRNLLIYLERQLQERVLRNMAYSLRPGGTLVLGPSEALGELEFAFDDFDRKWKVHERNAHSVPLQPGFGRFQDHDRGGERGRPDVRAIGGPPSVTTAEVEEVLRVLMDRFSTSCVVVDPNGNVLHVLGDVGRYLRLQTGRAQMDLRHLASRELEILLGAAMRRAQERGREVAYRGPIGDSGSDQVEIRVSPHLLRGREPVFVVSFQPYEGAEAEDVESVEVGDGRQRVQVLEEELRHTRENLQAMIEELETSNEELQTTNEELMSSNEELHAMNEELQSVNEELHTVNAEYQKKIQELTLLKDDVDNLLRSTRIGTLFLDRNLRIRSFTPAAVRYVHLLNQDIGRPIEHLSSQLVGLDLRAVSVSVLDSGEPIEKRVRTPEGEIVLVRVLPYVSEGEESRQDRAGIVVTFVDIGDVERARHQVQSVLDSLPAQIAVLDGDGRIVLVNEPWRVSAADGGAKDHPSVAVGANYLAACKQAGEEAAAGIRRVIDGERDDFLLEYPCHHGGQERWFLMQVARVAEPSGGVVVSHLEITERVLTERRRS